MLDLITPAKRRLLPPPLLSDQHVSPIQRIGGKQNVVSRLTLLAPEKILDYVEPFFGGGCMYFKLKKEGRITGKSYLSDGDVHLVTFMQVLQREPVRLANALYGVHERHGRGSLELFDHAVYCLLNCDQAFKRAVSFYIYNRLVRSSAALRYGRQSGFSKTHALTKGLTISHIRRLPAYGKLLEGAEINYLDYRKALVNTSDIRHNGFVFIDSPYEGRDKTLYETKIDFDEFANLYDQVSSRHYVMATLDARGANMERLSNFRQILHVVPYANTHCAKVEQIAINYKPEFMSNKVQLIGGATFNQTDKAS